MSQTPKDVLYLEVSRYDGSVEIITELSYWNEEYEVAKRDNPESIQITQTPIRTITSIDTEESIFLKIETLG